LLPPCVLLLLSPGPLLLLLLVLLENHAADAASQLPLGFRSHPHMLLLSLTGLLMISPAMCGLLPSALLAGL
jgi:hypothetical protein